MNSRPAWATLCDNIIILSPNNNDIMFTALGVGFSATAHAYNVQGPEFDARNQQMLSFNDLNSGSQPS